jgi:Rieske 2Fe-2S family protein
VTLETHVEPLPLSGPEPKSLPRRYYTSRDVLEDELELIFARTWAYVGHESQVAEPGDFFTAQLAGDNVIVSRGRDGDLHAFNDVCRHRGSRICGAGAHGNAERFVCPYHQWVYDVDGSLLSAPRMPELDRSTLGLKPVRLESWNGFLFANLSPDAPPLEAQLKGTRTLWDAYDVERVKLAHTITYGVHANWKLVLENFFECYHCAATHPEFSAVFDLNAYFETCAAAFQMRPGAKTLTLTGDYTCKLLMTREQPAEGEIPMGAARVGLTHTSAVSFWPDYALAFRFQPLDLFETEVGCDWFVHADAEAGRDYDVDDLIALWDITNRQDWQLCEDNQAGVSSRAYEPGPYHMAGEPQIVDFLRRYADVMGYPA